LELDRANVDWGVRLLFFRCGTLRIEIAHRLAYAGPADAPDTFYGLSWRVADLPAARARLRHAGFSVSDIRPGRRRGTQVATVRDAPAGIPTLLVEIGANAASI